jgi:cytochrome b6-f complex iron-sulfur subunit
MAETHEQVVKVWIAPGCIVCDACETDCPEVFDVQEETCLIRPDAVNAEFTKPLTPSIKTAAEGCPVDVIKFETIEVKGPEPWAGQEEAASETVAGGAGGGGGAKAKGPVIPDGPPDPKWAGLLTAARTSGSRSSGGPTATMRKPAKAPAEAVAMALATDAPPDAKAAAMVGSGYSRPRAGAVDRIRERAGRLAGAAKSTRRDFNVILAVAWGSIAFCGATAAAVLQSFMVPKLTKEPPSTFRAGKVSDYPEPGVYTNFKSDQGIWVVRLDNDKLVAISTICTHLGCIPNWLSADKKFKCPCHGSGFYMNGVNFEGPAPRPLERYAISLEGDTLLVDKSKKFREELGQWTDPKSFVMV